MKKKSNRPSDEYRGTANRNVFNKLHKGMLEKKGKIHCSWCGYHRGENDDGKYYGETRVWRRKDESIYRYPNWKLVSKKGKQWMDETYREEIRHNQWSGEDYVRFKF